MDGASIQYRNREYSSKANSVESSKILSSTWSICPVCMKRLPALRVQNGSQIFLEKTCKEHGSFSTVIWRGLYDFNDWIRSADEGEGEITACPDACGLCNDHLQKTCCTLLNITNRCDLGCRFCFASSGSASTDPSLDEIRKTIFSLVEKDKTLLQLSGGEPTMRDDLPDIIRIAREAGVKYVQLNTNGIRLGEDKNYARELAAAGLSFVFMQFDGTDDRIYTKLRGKALLNIKQRAIDNCALSNIGITLAPTLVRDVNTHDIGGIIRFALARAPAVRGVHFQPATFNGRVPGIPGNHDRITLDELVSEICHQSNGLIRSDDLLPSACDHPLCGFHGDFIASGDKLIPLLKRGETEKNCCCGTSAAEKNREFIARRWQRPAVYETTGAAGNVDIRDMSVFLERVKSHGFTLTSMAFQDAGNMDFSRLRHCSFHVYEDGKFIPFCSYYLTGWKQ